MRVLVIAAHPDDEVYGMGGTIAKLASEGNEVYVLIVTDGSTSQYRNHPDLKAIIERKKTETENANNVLGVKEVFFGELPDMKLDTLDHIKINKIIENTLEITKPKVVYTHFYGDVNLDHQRVYESTLVACRPTPNQTVKELYCYSVPSSTEWAPQNTDMYFRNNVVVNISDFQKEKTTAIEAYKTELRDFPHPRSVKTIETLDTALGLKYGIGPAEDFLLLRKIDV